MKQENVEIILIRREVRKIQKFSWNKCNVILKDTSIS